MFLAAIFSIFFLHVAAQSEDVDVCERFCPEDIKQTFFEQVLEQNLKRVESAVSEIINGIQKIRENVPNLEENLRNIGKSASEYIKDPLDRLQEEMDITRRSHLRAWNVISDTQMDIQDPSRSPKAPKTLSDLKTAIETLKDNYRTSEEHLVGALEDSLAEASDLLKPIVLLMEMMIKSAGEDNPLTQKLEGGGVNNFLGKVILRLTKVKQGTEEVPDVDFYQNLHKSSKIVEDIFNREARKSASLETVWRHANAVLATSETTKPVELEDVGVFFLEKLMDLRNADNYLAKVLQGMPKNNVNM